MCMHGIQNFQLNLRYNLCIKAFIYIIYCFIAIYVYYIYEANWKYELQTIFYHQVGISSSGEVNLLQCLDCSAIMDKYNIAYIAIGENIKVVHICVCMCRFVCMYGGHGNTSVSYYS